MASNPISLAENIKGEILYSVPLSQYTSFGVGGPVDYLVFPSDPEELQKTLKWCRKERMHYFFLGNGTNLLVRDGGVRGISILERRAKDSLLQAGAGEPLGRFLEFACEKGLSGMEWAAGIPGSVGGALFMNAGAFRSEMKDHLQSLQLMDPEGNLIEKGKEELQFSYRAVDLKKGWAILGGKFNLRIGSLQAIRSKMDEFLQKRISKQPLHLPSAGSVFKNPSRVAAGQLIEEVGLKGTRLRDAQISEKHANFIVNLGRARARDILTLAEWARDKVFEEKGVKLEMEIQVIGEDE
jgi:UDP-N-acetylmuramate dehydrogenase